MSQIRIKAKRIVCFFFAIIFSLMVYNQSHIMMRAASTPRYAYSVGCKHSLLGGYTGNFKPNVKYANTSYGTISTIAHSYRNYEPTYIYMRGVNPNGKRRIASFVVFLNGHANSSIILFNADNQGGDYATGVHKGADQSIGGYKYAGLESTNMSSCRLISFVGCKTAENNNNLASTAVNRGAVCSVGFTDTIKSRTINGKRWLKKYNDALASGDGVLYAVVDANNNVPNSNLSDNVMIYGNGLTKIAPEASKTVNEYSFENSKFYTEETDIPISKSLFNLASNNDMDKSNETINSISEYIAAYDSRFTIDDYHISFNLINPQTNSGIIRFTYYINNIIRTDKTYTAVFVNGIVKNITASIAATNLHDGVIKDALDIEKCSEAVRIHKPPETSFDLKEGDQIIENTVEYYYEYSSNSIICEHTVYYSSKEMCDVIIDKTKTERIKYY